ncbi:MAG TPA: GNAT family N-acetyltransferase [Candidatus Choladousia intestinigallinarum]|nr:GNAT family N-acetyltransferase [Candidatus Choladousia intestinigallinarum]
MIFEPKEMILKNEKSCLFRSPYAEDAAELLRYLKETSIQTPYLMREPEEVTLSISQEKEFIERQNSSERDLLLLAVVEGRHAGNGALNSLGSLKRYAHRCSISLALYEEFWSMGIGSAMLDLLLKKAKELGYEQAELEVVSTNHKAVSLYLKKGFQFFGRLPRSMKYKDGTYAEEYTMVKFL